MGIRHRLQSGNAVCRTAPAMREYYIRVLYRSKGTTRKYMTSHKNTSLGMVFTKDSSPQDLCCDKSLDVLRRMRHVVEKYEAREQKSTIAQLSPLPSPI